MPGILLAGVIHLSGHCDILRTLFHKAPPEGGRIPLNLSQHISDSTEIHLGGKATPPKTFRGTIAPLILSDENLTAASLLAVTRDKEG